MKSFAWIGVGILSLLVAGDLAWPRVCGTLEVLARTWWVLPVFASLASLLALEGSLVFRCIGRTKPSVIPTGAYLISGPSVAALNLSAFLPEAVPPPSWVGGLMLALLLGSAWAYFLTSKEQEDQTGKWPEADPPFQLTSC
jgi:hypothetical protein